MDTTMWLLIAVSVLAYNVLLLLSLILSGLCAQLLARRAGNDPLAAFLAGAFFAVGAHRWIRLGSLSLQPAEVALRLAVAAAGWRLRGAAGAVHRQ